MVVGDLVILTGCRTTGFKDGQIGIITKIEPVGELFSIYWVLMSEGEVPMWDNEFEVLNERRGSDNSNV
jgi:hypothetical protein